VDRLRLGDFAVRPAPDLLRRGDGDADGVEVRNGVAEIEWARTVQSSLRALRASGQWLVVSGQFSFRKQRTGARCAASVNPVRRHSISGCYESLAADHWPLRAAGPR